MVPGTIHPISCKRQMRYIGVHVLSMNKMSAYFGHVREKRIREID